MGRMTADAFATVKEFEPPLLDPERPEERLDGELVKRLSGDRLAHERGVIEGVRRVPAARPGIERQLLHPLFTGETENIFPRTAVGRARRLRCEPGSVIEQLLHG